MELTFYLQLFSLLQQHICGMHLVMSPNQLRTRQSSSKTKPCSAVDTSFLLLAPLLNGTQLCTHISLFFISFSFADRNPKSKTKPLVGEFNEAWWFAESASWTKKRQVKITSQKMLKNLMIWNMLWIQICHVDYELSKWTNWPFITL